MKNLFLMALGAVAMVSCTQGEEDLVNDRPVEIRLNANIASSVRPKAVINPGEAVAAVQFARVDGNAPDWTTISAIQLTGDVAASGTIAFSALQHYPSNGEAANLLAFYPAAKSVAAGVAAMEISGDEDVMYAAPVSGNKTTPIVDDVQLKHLLTQFTFVVKREAASTPADITDVTIAVSDANTTFNLALTDGTLSNWGTPISTITPVTAGVAGVTASAASTGIMLQPDMTSIALVVSANGYPSQTVTVAGTDGGKFAVGKSYEIALTFKGTAIESTATIEEWLPGTDGSEDIQ